MERYKTAFYAPLVADWSNFGTWSENGGLTASARATAIWKRILRDERRPETDGEKVDDLRRFIDRRTAAGGAPPES